MAIRASKLALIPAMVIAVSGCKYSFNSAFEPGASSVSYTGQTKRHVLIEDMVDEILALPARPVDASMDIAGNLDFYFSFDGGTSDGLNHSFSISGESLLQDGTYGGISSGKDLVGKIAGNDPALLDDEFFGWTTGMDTDPTPEELVSYMFNELDSTAKSAAIDLVTAGGPASITLPYITATGIDYRQLIQKFLLGAVTFSQGTADYLSTDWRAANVQEGDNPYSEGEHNWDEAFGYFGAARDYTDYTDDEIAGSSGRAAYAGGYFDSNGDGLIDIASEYNFGNSTNCAKRDRGTAGNTNPTDFTTNASTAFYYGRLALWWGAIQGEITNTELVIIESMAEQASLVWEKCIAATVVHYINDVSSDMGNFSGGQFADDTNFTDLAKHWAEMKGFALGLQFSPFSPFRSGKVAGIDLDDLKQVLALMGDAPVLPDGTQGGSAFAGGTTQYLTDLMTARNILEQAYEFDSENVANW